MLTRSNTHPTAPEPSATPHPLPHLLKYDLKTIFHYLGVLYIITLALAIVARLLTSFSQTTFFLSVGQLLTTLATGLTIGITINTSIYAWRLFRSDFYGDRSYLTHTLPIAKRTLLTSKFLAALITCLTTLLIVALTIAILYLTPDDLTFLDAFITEFGQGRFIGYAILLSILIFVEFANVIICGFTGIIIGYRANSHRSLFSVLAGLVVYYATGLCVVLVFLVIGLFNPNLMAIFTDQIDFSSDVFLTLLISSTITYLFTAIGAYFLATHLLNKGVNVD